ncbi:hypothetical protein PSTG_14336 [Puccinia striiformis f. sp. tritici PST-78]|uniref:Uncharacterized protein n=1 Tax=Puccinia striiformis f. sp. tritici PST-78 TaxID=1165861 RepID=A0A0L0UYV8_9BASI|nr:hypothetical protein PSTG_14336 [Puccinia striiformis f. sp. tritici PST-78]
MSLSKPYNTFQALQSDCSLPLVASPQCLIRSISCSLISIRTVVNSQQPRNPEATELSDRDVDKHFIPPDDAISETILRFSEILGQMDIAILNPMLYLEANRQQAESVAVTSASNTLCFERTVLGTTLARKLTLQLAKNLKRVGAQLESFVYWTDNFLLASLANSTRADPATAGSSRSIHIQREQIFDDLIDQCVDIAQAGWSIRSQISQAHAILTGGLTQHNSNRSLSPPCHRRKSSIALRLKPRLQYELGNSLGRRLRHRSARKLLPRKATRVHRSMTRLIALLEPDNSLKVIHVARQLLLNNLRSM